MKWEQTILSQLIWLDDIQLLIYSPQRNIHPLPVSTWILRTRWNGDEEIKFFSITARKSKWFRRRYILKVKNASGCSFLQSSLGTMYTEKLAAQKCEGEIELRLGADNLLTLFHWHQVVLNEFIPISIQLWSENSPIGLSGVVDFLFMIFNQFQEISYIRDSYILLLTGNCSTI